MHVSDPDEKSRALGYGGYLAAILLCCLIVGWLAYSQGRESERRYEAAHQHAQSAKAYAQVACVGLDPAAAFECISDAVETGAETARAEQDLDAQQWMAFWALLMVIVNTVMAVVTAIGIFYVKRTLDATLDALEQSGKATSAMVQANEIAKTSQRPWLQIEVVMTKVEGSDHRLLLRFESRTTNVGKMVAERCSIRGSIIARDSTPEGQAKIANHRLEAERISQITDVGPIMPYPILPGETKTQAGEIEIRGDIPTRKLESGEERTPHVIFLCARYFIPGEAEMRITDRGFSIDYDTEPDNPFGIRGIPVPLPDDLALGNVVLRSGGHNRTT